MLTTAILAPTIPKEVPAVPSDLIWRLSVDQFHDMIQSGILTDDDPVELLEGWLVYKMPNSSQHRLATRLMRQELERIVPAGFHVDSQEPITLKGSEPEPDVALVRGDARDYGDHHPNAADVLLVVEVADTTLHRDRGQKKSLYARAGIPGYWIVNLSDGILEVYTDPSGSTDKPDYRQRKDLGIEDSLSVMIENREIGHLALKDVFP